MKNAILLFVWFMLGGCISSAVSCFLYRIHTKQDWFKGRSKCEHCNRELAWYELIPVFSCLLLRGRCKSCGYYFGYRHTVMETLTGVYCMALFYMFGVSALAVVMEITFTIAFAFAISMLGNRMV